MTEFYISRHGQTEFNQQKRLQGWIDTPLTAEGVQNAKSAAAKLRGLQIDSIISSDLGRAFVTAYLVVRELGIDIEIERSSELREVNYGDLAGKPYSAYPNLTPQENATFVSPNGESLVQMQQRVLGYIQQLTTHNPNGTILLVAHDGTINAIRANFSGESMGTADLTRNAHDFVAKFTHDGSKVTSFNELGL
jgi:broad specificity phosphatase PhoE